MFILPVCQVNIIDTIVQDIEFGSISYEDASVTGLSCKNQNRFIDSTCEIAQTIEIVEETGIELTQSRSQGREVTWSFGAEVTFNAPGGKDYPYLEISGNFERAETSYNEVEKARTDTVYQSTSKSVECTGSIDVPPNHEIDYVLTLSQEVVTLTTSNTLELILCSAFLSDDDDNTISEESGDIEYEYNVPGAVYTVTASVCTVTFGTAQRIIGLDLPCDEMNALAVRTGATYMPLCQEADATKYDGCQCETGDKLTEAPCYCVNEITGAIVGGSAIFSEDSDWRDTCRTLACPNSIYQPQPTAAPTSSPSQAPTDAPTASPTQAPTRAPTNAPTQSPTQAPTFSPTQSPTDLTLNINAWEADITRSDDGLLCFYNPDINNPYRVCVQLIAITQTNEICDTSATNNQILNQWHQYDYIIEDVFELNEPPNPNRIDIFVKQITIIVENDITIKFQLFYNKDLSEFENGLTAYVNIDNGWPFNTNSDNNQLYTLAIEYGVYIEGNPDNEYTESTQLQLNNNAKLYYDQIYKNAHVSTNLIDGGLYYLLNSNEAYYDSNSVNRVGVHFSDEYYGPSDNIDTTDDNNDQDIYYVRLCFHHFDDNLIYDTLAYNYV